MSSPHPIDDIALSAWLDGELPRAEARIVEKAIAENPGLQQRIDALLSNEQKIKGNFRQMVQERPVPKALSRLLESRSDESEGWLRTMREWLGTLGPGPGLAAASVALAALAGVLVTQLVSDRYAIKSPNAGLVVIDPDHHWYPLLESTASGELRDLAGRQVGLVALSYRSAEGLFCRQFQVRGRSQKGATAAVACRESGRWQIELAQRVPVAVDQSDFFRAASGGELNALDAFITQHSEGELLVGASEAAILRNGWQ